MARSKRLQIETRSRAHRLTKRQSNVAAAIGSHRRRHRSRTDAVPAAASKASITQGIQPVVDNQNKGMYSCSLCGVLFSNNYQQKRSNAGQNAAKHWSKWKADCQSSLYSLFSSSHASIKDLSINLCCNHCSVQIWDIHFAIKRIRAMERRLQKLRTQFEEKLKLREDRKMQRKVDGGERTKVLNNMELIARRLLNVNSKSHCHTASTPEWPEVEQLQEERSLLDEVENDDVPESPKPNNDVDVKMEVDSDAEWCPTVEGDELEPDEPDGEYKAECHEESDEDDVPLAVRRDRVMERERRNEPSDPVGSPACNYGEDLSEMDVKPDISESASVPVTNNLSTVLTSVLVRDDNIGNIGVSDVEDQPKSVRKRRLRSRPRRKIRKIRKMNNAVDDLAEDAEQGSESELPQFEACSKRKRKCHSFAMKSRRCDICFVVLRGRKALKVHMAQEHADRIFACQALACSARYKSKDNLEVHMLEMHGGHFSFYCPICLQGFESPETLTEHEQIHNSSNPFICSVCQTVFTSSLDLQRHVRTHTHTLRCPHPNCDKTFASKITLKNHIEYHRRSEVRSEICDICGLRVLKDLKSHLASHSTERKSICHLCGKTYKIDGELKRHLRVKHGGGGSFPCKICGKIFETSKQQKRHEETHSKMKQFACNICSKQFRTSNAVSCHIRQMHDPRYDKIARRVLKSNLTEMGSNNSTTPIVPALEMTIQPVIEMVEEPLPTDTS